jgi:hypothetical protein
MSRFALLAALALSSSLAFAGSGLPIPDPRTPTPIPPPGPAPLPEPSPAPPRDPGPLSPNRPAPTTDDSAGTAGLREPPALDRVVASWPQDARDAAVAWIGEYGAPDESTRSILVWNDTGPWKRNEVHRHATEHAEPVPHEDFSEQVVAWNVPPDKIDEIAALDASLQVDRGELTARCDSEAANMLALNTAVRLASGQLTLDGARTLYAEGLADIQAGRPPKEAKQLLFDQIEGERPAPRPGSM